jgi:hypothetical protein
MHRSLSSFVLRVRTRSAHEFLPIIEEVANK